MNRGIDQILPHPGDPELREPGVSHAGGFTFVWRNLSAGRFGVR